MHRVHRPPGEDGAADARAGAGQAGRLHPRIGYPDSWRDYSALEIERGDYAGNVRRAAEFEARRQFARVGRPVDRAEWGMTPQTVNAYYNPLRNEIVFPAGIMQPPFFDPAADDAVNYGAMGAIIGHEIMHASTTREASSTRKATLPTGGGRRTRRSSGAARRCWWSSTAGTLPWTACG